MAYSAPTNIYWIDRSGSPIGKTPLDNTVFDLRWDLVPGTTIFDYEVRLGNSTWQSRRGDSSTGLMEFSRSYLLDCFSAGEWAYVEIRTRPSGVSESEASGWVNSSSILISVREDEKPQFATPSEVTWVEYEGITGVSSLPKSPQNPGATKKYVDLSWNFVTGATSSGYYEVEYDSSNGTTYNWPCTRFDNGKMKMRFTQTDFIGASSGQSVRVRVRTKGDSSHKASSWVYSPYLYLEKERYGISWIVWYNDRGIASNSSHAQAGTVELNGRSYTKCPYDTYEEGTQIELNFNLGENKFNRDFIPPTQPDYVNTGYSGPINDWLTFIFSVYGKVTVSFNTEESKIKVDPERIFYKENVYLSALKREDEKRSRKVTLDDQTGNPVTEILKEEKTHYEFEGWRIGPKDNPYIPGFSPPILKDTVFTEVWKPPEILPAYLTEEDLPKPIRQGYKLIGWFYDKEGKNPVDFMQELTQDITIYACWERTGNPIFIYTNSVWKQYMPKIYKNGMWQDCTAKLRLPSKWDE